MINDKIFEVFDEVIEHKKIDIETLDLLIGGFEILGLQPIFEGGSNKCVGIDLYVKNKNNDLLMFDFLNDENGVLGCTVAAPCKDCEEKQ